MVGFGGADIFDHSPLTQRESEASGVWLKMSAVVGGGV
jgi:hypothetical protein